MGAAWENAEHADVLRAAARCVSSDGYRKATVEDICTTAGVARSTFYKHFTDKKECYLAALDAIVGALLQHRPGVRAALELAADYPKEACALLVEAHACDPPALAKRQEALDAAAGWMGGEALAAAVAGLIMARVPYSQEDELPGLADGVSSWADVCSKIVLEPAATREVSRRRGQAPGSLIGERLRTLPPGPKSDPRELIQANQRDRLLDAVALVVSREGLDALTVGSLVAEAAVSRRTFYEHFSSPDSAFVAALELGCRSALDVTRTACAAAGDWRESIAATTTAFCGFLAEEPAFARICLVDAFGAGRAALDVREDAQREFARLLHQAYLSDNVVTDGTPPKLAAEAGAAAIFELCAARVRRDATAELPGLAPAFAELLVAPREGAVEEREAAS